VAVVVVAVILFPVVTAVYLVVLAVVVTNLEQEQREHLVKDLLVEMDVVPHQLQAVVGVVQALLEQQQLLETVVMEALVHHLQLLALL
jgi:hypothetical protein